jgi:hypothetical protein
MSLLPPISGYNPLSRPRRQQFPKIVGFQRMADQMLLAGGVGVSGAVRWVERMIRILET